MPLKKSASKAAFKQNVREMMRAGNMPQKQVLAAAYATQRKAKQGKK